jgi:hypothetical protein
MEVIPEAFSRVAQELRLPVEGLMHRSLKALLLQEMRAAQMDMSDFKGRYGGLTPTSYAPASSVRRSTATLPGKTPSNGNILKHIFSILRISSPKSMMYEELARIAQEEFKDIINGWQVFFRRAGIPLKLMLPIIPKFRRFPSTFIMEAKNM